jgi:hypothetical protein
MLEGCPSALGVRPYLLLRCEIVVPGFKKVGNPLLLTHKGSFEVVALVILYLFFCLEKRV